MKRRKGKLLELLRQQDRPAAVPGPSAPARLRPDPERSPSQVRRPFRLRWKARLPAWDGRALAARLRLDRVPWLAAGVVGILAVPLAFWMAGGFAAEAAELDRMEAPALAAARAAEAAALERDPPAAAGLPPPPSAGGGKQYGILVITYDDNPANRDRAHEVRKALVEQGLPEVKLLGRNRGPDGSFDYLEVFVGRAHRPEALESLLRRVQELELPARPGRKDFRDATVRPYPRTSP